VLLACSPENAGYIAGEARQSVNEFRLHRDISQANGSDGHCPPPIATLDLLLIICTGALYEVGGRYRRNGAICKASSPEFLGADVDRRDRGAGSWKLSTSHVGCPLIPDPIRRIDLDL